MNSFNVAGRVGKDAEVRQAGKTPVTSFSLAYSSPFGEKKTTWFNVSLFGDRFTKLAGYIKKGDFIAVTGSVEEKEFTGRDGEIRKSLEINATDVTLVPGGSKSGAGSSSSDDEEDSEIPF